MEWDVSVRWETKPMLSFNVYISDVFKIPLHKIELVESFQTRELSETFVNNMKDMLVENLSLDSVVYVASLEIRLMTKRA